jgi:AraC family transcriptional regulator
VGPAGPDDGPEGEAGVQAKGGGTYAVFLHKGGYERLGAAYDSFFAGWLPGSGKVLRGTLSFEVYLSRGHDTKPAERQTEIWVPVR